MGDYERCAEVCEDRGFARQAALLRAVGEGRGRAYVVQPTHWIEEGWDWDEAGEPGPAANRKIYLDREAAEKVARERSAQVLRGFGSPHGIELTYSFDYLTNLSRSEFCARVAEILGTPYRLPADNEPLIPESATDEQLLRIVPLLSIEFFTVATVPIAP